MGNITQENKQRLSAFKAACIYPFDAWVYDEWNTHNETYFDGQLLVGQIVWGLTAYGHAVGLYSGWRNMITLYKSIIEPDETWQGGIRGRERAASDILLHEMVHQKTHQMTGGNGAKNKSQTSHNNELWVSEIKRISSMLGYSIKADVITSKRAKTADGHSYVKRHICEGCLTQGEMASFPHSIRPRDYYRNTETDVFFEGFKFD